MAKRPQDIARLYAGRLNEEEAKAVIADLGDPDSKVSKLLKNVQQDTQRLMNSPQIIEQVQQQDPRPSFQDLQAQMTVIEKVMDAHKQARKHAQANEHEQAAACYARAVEAIQQGPIGITGDREYRQLFLDAAEHARQHPQTVTAEWEHSQRDVANKIHHVLGTEHRTCGAGFEAAAATSGALAEQQQDPKFARWAHQYLGNADIAYSFTVNDPADREKDHLRIREQLEASKKRQQQIEQAQEEGYDGPDL